MPLALTSTNCFDHRIHYGRRAFSEKKQWLFPEMILTKLSSCFLWGRIFFCILFRWTSRMRGTFDSILRCLHSLPSIFLYFGVIAIRPSCFVIVLISDGEWWIWIDVWGRGGICLNELLKVLLTFVTTCSLFVVLCIYFYRGPWL